ncbi:hypothetical protein EDD11_007756 [Mortierella claussenii]|nr:hypothetical protein EDD11_007756 [Mortierella claussenii]
MRTTTILATATLLAATASIQDEVGIQETLDDHNNFIVANGWGPERWGCSFTRTQVHESPSGTVITIGKDSELKPFSCGELIHKVTNLGYGTYSIDMIASNIVGQVTSFFLIANEDTEIDIELTGLNARVGWMNVWHDHQQNPVMIDLPFDASKDWHSYSFDWFRDHIVWYVDGTVVLNRSDIVTTAPDKADYKLVINSWTQVQPEINIEWAGKFQYPQDGRIPQAKYRNMKYVPRVYNNNCNSNDGTKKGGDSANGTSNGGKTSQGLRNSSAELAKSPASVAAIGGTAIIAVAFAFILLF